MRCLVYSILFTVLFFYSCEEKNKKKDITIDEDFVKEKITEKNKENVSVEDSHISDYLRRRNWDFKKTKTGIRYKTIDEGYGLTPKKGDIVILSYSVESLRGEEFYNSKADGKMNFVVDKSDEITGLHQAVKLMKTGDRTKFIIPSYLAFGVTGDDKKIPRNTTLVYELKLEQIR